MQSKLISSTQFKLLINAQNRHEKRPKPLFGSFNYAKKILTDNAKEPITYRQQVDALLFMPQPWVK